MLVPQERNARNQLQTDPQLDVADLDRLLAYLGHSLAAAEITKFSPSCSTRTLSDQG